MRKLRKGFTLAELVIAVGIATILFGLGTVVLLRTQRAPLQSATVDKLVADIKSQQTQAMAGDTQGSGVQSDYGVYFGSTTYTLFRGATYSSSDPANFVVDLEGNQQFTNITFPGSILIFTVGNGQVDSFVAGNNAVGVVNSDNGAIKTISVNEFGSIDVN